GVAADALFARCDVAPAAACGGAEHGDVVAREEVGGDDLRHTVAVQVGAGDVDLGAVELEGRAGKHLRLPLAVGPDLPAGVAEPDELARRRTAVQVGHEAGAGRDDVLQAIV